LRRDDRGPVGGGTNLRRALDGLEPPAADHAADDARVLPHEGADRLRGGLRHDRGDVRRGGDARGQPSSARLARDDRPDPGRPRSLRGRRDRDGPSRPRRLDRPGDGRHDGDPRLPRRDVVPDHGRRRVRDRGQAASVVLARPGEPRRPGRCRLGSHGVARRRRVDCRDDRARVPRLPARHQPRLRWVLTLRRMQDVLTVPNEVAAELAGVGDGVLDTLRERLGCSISLRGNRLTLDGDDERVVEARAVVDELVELVEGGHAIGPDTVGAVVAALDQAADIRDVFEDVVWRHRGKKIAPKTVTQKRYVDTIRRETVTFAIGPAGTGKTYLAIALAVKALSEREVGRIILTRPAV